MTLKEFAEYHCINYQTAKTWLRRGRIVSEGRGFKILPPRPGETVPVNLKPGESLKPYAEALKSETVEVEVSEIETAKLGVTLPPLAEGQSDWTVAPASLHDPKFQIPRLPIPDSAQDSHGSEGADLPPESNRESCVEYDRETISRADCDPRTKTEIAQSARVARLEAENVNQQQYLVALKQRVTALEDLVAETRAALIESNNHIIRLNEAIVYDRQRIRNLENAQSDEPVVAVTASHPIDPPGPNWGA